jgi:NitT/TauT family transport system permease protein
VTSEAASSVAAAEGSGEVAATPAPPSARTRRPNQFFAFRGTLSRRAHIVTAVTASLAVVVLWELSTRLGWMNAVFFPPPSATLATLWNMILNKNLLMHAGISTLRVWAAFLLSVVMAVPIGIAMSSFRGVGAALEPLIDFIRYLPVPALVPLSIIWFGVGEETKIFLLWLGTFFQLVLLVADDMRRVPQEYVEIAYTVGARPQQMLVDVAFRAMLPSLFDNLRITLGWCWTYLIIAEIVAADKGLGFVIWAARRYMNTTEVMAGVVAIGLIGLLTDQLLRLAHKRLFRYL